MPSFTCDHNSFGQPYKEQSTTKVAPDGSGHIEILWRYVWDGVSVYPNCDGDVTYFELTNDSQMTAWASLPAKKSGLTYFQIDPGAHIGPITAKGQLQQNGISRNLDIQPDNRLQFTQPAG